MSMMEYLGASQLGVSEEMLINGAPGLLIHPSPDWESCGSFCNPLVNWGAVVWLHLAHGCLQCRGACASLSFLSAVVFCSGAARNSQSAFFYRTNITDLIVHFRAFHVSIYRNILVPSSFIQGTLFYVLATCHALIIPYMPCIQRSPQTAYEHLIILLVHKLTRPTDLKNLTVVESVAQK